MARSTSISPAVHDETATAWRVARSPAAAVFELAHQRAVGEHAALVRRLETPHHPLERGHRWADEGDPVGEEGRAADDRGLGHSGISGLLVVGERKPPSTVAATIAVAHKAVISAAERGGEAPCRDPRRREYALESDEREHGGRSGPPAVHELVVDVAPVASEERLSRAEPSGYGYGGVDGGDRDDERRAEPRRCATALEGEDAAEGQGGAEEVGTTVAEVDARRRPVVHEEAGECAAERQRDHPRVGAEGGEAERRGEGRSRRETVEAVEEVHGVDEADHDHGGESDPESRLQAGCGHHDPGEDADSDLAGESHRRRHLAGVVGHAEGERRCEGGEERRPVRPDRACHGNGHGETAEVGDGLTVHLEGAGVVHEPGGVRESGHDRGRGECDGECHGEG